MPEPHSTATAALGGSAAAIPVAGGIAAALGVPFDLLGWAMFGGLVAMANSEPVAQDMPRWKLALHIGLRLGIAAGVGGLLALIGALAAIPLASRIGVALVVDDLLLHASAVVLGGATAFLPEINRIIKARLGAMGGAEPKP